MKNKNHEREGKNMKYYVCRISKITGRKEYKLRKTLDIYVGEMLKGNCWQYSKQGARGIVERENAHGWNYDFFTEEVTE